MHLLCVMLMQVPAALGGPEGQVIYIDTEGSFMIDRVVDIASAAVARVNDAAAACSTDVQPQVSTSAPCHLLWMVPLMTVWLCVAIVLFS